ncbi:hypothetical protein PIB30_067601 [Stylosanthes scabra]|uniref:Amidase domain-containing protein n=1 Tax=Stylosanthes scabra TaxID=79078 RepID=A0ABU6WQH8_9FABA|nr:hypothetical protein [Stylosanthes scabra]
MASTSVYAFSFLQFIFLILLVTLSSVLPATSEKQFSIKEATVDDLQLAFKRNQLSSRKLVEFYLTRIQGLNPILRGGVGGSYALLGSVVPRDAGVVTRLRKAGAITLGKATLSEWSHYRAKNAPNGWSARGGQGKNPYTGKDPGGSSSGSAISVAANMVTVSLGTDTAGSILIPSDYNSVLKLPKKYGTI